MAQLQKPTLLSIAARKFCVPLLFAEKLADGSIDASGGTALLLETAKGRFLVTAMHVWSGLIAKSNLPGGSMTIAIPNGQKFLSVTDASVVAEADDVVVLKSVRLSACTPEGKSFYHPLEWPIPPINDSEIVGFTGFPKDYRKISGYQFDTGSWHTECPCRVGSGGRYLIPGSNLGAERESVQHVKNPPPLEDIGGSSGAPVFVWRDGRAILIGIVTDGTDGAGVQSTIWISPLTKLQENGKLTY